MFHHNIDFLSPQITLYHKGLLYHSSIISGILSILFCIIFIIFTVSYLTKLWNRESDTQKMNTFNGFIENASEYIINSSSFFNFINSNKIKNALWEQGIDFTYFDYWD